MKTAALVLVVLAAAAIWIFDPAPARQLRDEVAGLFLTAVFAIGLIVILLLILAVAGAAFASIWGRGYNEAKVKVQQHRGVAVPAFLSIISGLTVTQASQAIETVGSAKAVLFGAVTVCATGLGALLQDRADQYGDPNSWRWARGIGMGLLILPLAILVAVGLADHWWNYFADADGIDQACLILTFLIEVGTVLAGWALNKRPKAVEPAATLGV